MIRFNTIQDFINLMDKCPFCNKELYTSLHGKIIPNRIPSYIMNFEYTEFHSIEEREREREREIDLAFVNLSKKEVDKIVYFSKLDNDYLHFNYALGDVTNCILSINIKTNKILQATNRAQNIIWDHKPVIFRGCRTCPKSTYLSETNQLSLDIKNNKIYSLYLDSEIVTMPHDDTIYGLMSLYNNNVTYLTNTERSLKELPLMNLWKMKDGESIINKIKTMIVFL